MAEPPLSPVPAGPDFPADDLRLLDVHALRGPNPWSLAPVIACEVATGRLAAISPSGVAGFAGRLREEVPTLGAPAPGGSWPQVLERLAAELQRLAGAPVPFSRVVSSGGEKGTALLVVGYAEEALGEASLHEAVALVRRCLRGEEPGAARVVAGLRELYHRTRPGPTATVLIEAARRRGIPVRRLPGDRVVQLGLGRNLRRLDATMTDSTSVIATDLTSDKDRTKRILKHFGLPVPEGRVATTPDEAVEIAQGLGYPVLLKPLDANDGRGISGRLDGSEGVRDAWPVAAAEHPRVVVERFFAGRDHRVVVVNGHVVAVAERVPAHVTGDGRRTVRELAEEENRDPKRELLSPRATLAPLPIDEDTARFLARRGRTLDTVPPAGERVQLRATANISTGGTSVDRTDEIHPRNAALCELAAGVAGLDVAGLDVLTPDISVPFAENGAAIIEVNASPGIRMHTDPDAGTPRDVPGAILEMLYPPGSEAGIPVIAVTGARGTTTTTRLLAHLLRRTGRRVGWATAEGIYLDDIRLIDADRSGTLAADVVLSHPRVDAAVLEAAGAEIRRSGLGFDACDVGIVLGVSADHADLQDFPDEEQLPEGVIPAVVGPGGYVVLNADNPLVHAMREQARGEVVLISALGEQRSPPITEHLAASGLAVLVEEAEERETIVLRRGEERTPVAPVEEVAPTAGDAGHIEMVHVLAAVAAAHALAITPAEIRDALGSFPQHPGLPRQEARVPTQNGPLLTKSRGP